MIVGRERGRLDDEDILAAHILLNFDEDLHVGEAPDLAFCEREAEIGGNRFGQRAVRIARYELDAIFHAGPQTRLQIIACCIAMTAIQAS